ncbi:hypothetical protein RSJ42_17835 [Methanosarcina hadiensis]|uniref:hypothetical protein n=1 Tax=Methanosarcina hadiensis TaxID=3078083 RepID=UPI00397733DC
MGRQLSPIRNFYSQPGHSRRETWSEEESPEGRFRKFSYNEIGQEIKQIRIFSGSRTKSR